VSRPRIGICAYRTHARWTHWDLEATVIPQGYVDGVRLAGGVPILLPPTPDGAEDPGEVLDGIDGLILTGGPDIDPALYGAELHEGTDEPTPERRVRDAFELALLRCARERSLPVLGICRGVQLMNVERGGTLVQDLGEVELDLAPHRPQLGTFGRHRVATEAGTAAADALGAFVDDIHSHHHQGIAEVGEGLVVSARAEDGSIEALEDPTAAFCLGVLWHPEEAAGTAGAPLFRALVEAASERRNGAGGAGVP
jgi:putative glutamine amidotransferase